MAEPRIIVLGVHSLPVSEELFREQFEILYGYPMTDEQRVEAEEQCREQLLSVVLIETLVENRDEKFSIGDFSQEQDGVERDNWQVAWAEMILSIDGDSILVERWNELPGIDSFRVAFFLHFWDESKPLLTSYGAVQCPNITDMPERLRNLVPYEPVD